MKITELENAITKKDQVTETNLLGFLDKALNGPGRAEKMKQLAIGTLKVWQMQYKKLVQDGILEGRRPGGKSAILEGILDEDSVLKVGGKWMHKRDADNKWLDDNGDIISRPEDVAELEKRLTMQNQTRSMNPASQAAVNNASKEKTIPKKTDPSAAPATTPADATTASKEKAGGPAVFKSNRPDAVASAPTVSDTEKVDTGLLDKNGNPLTKDVPKAADPGAGVAPNLLKYRQEFAKFLAKAFHIPDVGKVYAYMNDVNDVKPTDEAALVPIIQKVQQLAATDPDRQAELGLVQNKNVDQAALKTALQSMLRGNGSVTQGDLNTFTKYFGADHQGQTADQKISALKRAGVTKATGLT